VIRIDVQPVGETWPTRYTLPMLNPHMVPEHTYLTWSAHSNLSLANHRVRQSHYSQEKRNSWLHPQHAGWSICWSWSSFSPTLNQRSSGESQIYVDSRLLGLSGSYLLYVVSTFNTSSRGPTHQPLTDTGRGYKLRGASFPHHTLWPSHPMILRFTPKGPA
jgi:hypothetical protein